MTDYKDYQRHPIQINVSTIMMVELFHLDNCHHHCSECDCPNKLKADLASHQEGADQFIKQLEGHWNDAFLKALRDRIDQELSKRPKRRIVKNVMLEKALMRPSNFFSLSERGKWDIDKSLGILDWDPTKEEEKEFKKRWKQAGKSFK